MFIYKYENNVDKNQLVKLFESVGWKTAEYPNRLYNAIKNSEYVMTVWNGENLIGLISAITDGYINVFIIYSTISGLSESSIIYSEFFIISDFESIKSVVNISIIFISTTADTISPCSSKIAI